MPVARGGSSISSRGARSFNEVSRSYLRARGSISTSEVRVGGSGLRSWAVLAPHVPAVAKAYFLALPLPLLRPCREW